MKFITLAATLLVVFTGSAAAQTYDPKTQSPLTLLQAPSDGVAYYQMREEVRSLYANGSNAQAEPLAEQLVHDYPRDGENWLLLARLKTRLNKPAEAAAAYEKVGPLLGWGPFAIPGWNAAINHLEAGNREQAFAAMRREVYEHHTTLRRGPFEWSQFASLQNDAEFREITGRTDASNLGRHEGWTRDVDFLYNEIKRVNPDYRDAPFPAEFERRYKELKTKIPQLTDEEVFFGMQRMLAVLRQGHTILFNVPQSRYLPLLMYAFPEGIHVIDAGEGHKTLIGAKVLNIGSITAEEALRRWAEAQSVDGDMQYVWGTSTLAYTYVLKGMGAITRADTVSVTLQLKDGRKTTVPLATVTTAPPRKLIPPQGATAPMFLRNVAEQHWEQALPQHNALFIQMNQVTNEPNETLMQFGMRMRKLLADTKPKNVILDLRHNNGGSTFNYLEFLRTMVSYTAIEGNQLYVLIGRNSYSATANLITDLERLAAPIFVGEASSECCNLYGDPSSVVLPYSKIQGEVTGVKWNLSINVFDGRREMSPHVPVQLTAKHYFAGEDPALAAIFKLIAARGR
jgi:hypothetical protein